MIFLIFYMYLTAHGVMLWVDFLFGGQSLRERYFFGSLKKFRKFEKILKFLLTKLVMCVTIIKHRKTVDAEFEI